MSKFDSIEIATIVALHPKVARHRFFGLFDRVYYQPTHSHIESYRNFYNSQEAKYLQEIAESKDPSALLTEAHDLQTSDQGSFCLDFCMSKDHNFIAFQVFEHNKQELIPFSKLCILEGAAARSFESLLV